MRKYCLPAIAGGRYISPAGVNPPAGRRNPFNEQRRHRRAQRLFCVVPSRTHAQRQNPHCIYGGAGGAAEGWPVSFAPVFLPPPASPPLMSVGTQAVTP